MDKPDCKGLLVLVVLPLDFLWGVPVVLWGDPVEKLSLLSIDEYKTFDVPDVGRLVLCRSSTLQSRVIAATADDPPLLLLEVEFIEEEDEGRLESIELRTMLLSSSITPLHPGLGALSLSFLAASMCSE